MITERTVKFRAGNIHEKLGVRSRAAAMRIKSAPKSNRCRSKKNIAFRSRRSRPMS